MAELLPSQKQSFLSVHSCHGETDPGPYLQYQNFRSLLESHKENKEIYCRHYSGGRLVKELSFAGLVCDAFALAQKLTSDYGMEPGDCVVVQLGNRDTALVAHCALLALGAVAVPVDPAIAPDDLAYILVDSEAKGLLTTNGKTAPQGWKGAVIQEQAIVRGQAGCCSLETPFPDRETFAVIVYTSGTTGKPKGVCLTQGNLLANLEATRRVHSMDAGSVHMAVLPLFHVNAFCFSFLTTLYCGARLVLNRSFYPAEFWNIVHREAVQVVSVVPTIIQMLIDDRRNLHAKDVPGNLAYMVTAAAPLSRVQARAFHERYGIRIIQAYGLSEAVNFSLTVPVELNDEDYRKFFLDRSPPPAGCPVFGNEVEVVRPDGVLCEEGETGEVVLRGFNVMRGYLNKPQATAEAFRDGWFHTGDLGWRERHADRDFFFLQGRIKDIALRKGENVSLPALDEKLQQIEGLGQCCTVPYAEAMVGEEIGLFVAYHEAGLSADEILRRCRDVLGTELAPKAVVFGDALPRTATGKLKRTSLRPLFEGGEK